MNKDNDKWKEKYKNYIASPEWKSLKLDLLQRRGCKCERCAIKKHPTKLHIHHLTYKRLYDELPQDLIILCAICHMKEHGLIEEKKKPVHKKRKPKEKKENPLNSNKIYHKESQANESFISKQRKKHKNYSIYN